MSKLKGLENIPLEVLQKMFLSNAAIVWRIKATWTSNGREGSTNLIVAADTAIEALIKFWETEDDKQLRNIEIEWLCPITCIVGLGLEAAESEQLSKTPSDTYRCQGRSKSQGDCSKGCIVQTRDKVPTMCLYFMWCCTWDRITDESIKSAKGGD